MSLSSNLFRVSPPESAIDPEGLHDDEARRRRYLRRYVIVAVAVAASICVVAGLRVALTRTDVATHLSDVAALHRQERDLIATATASEPPQPGSATGAPLITPAETTSASAEAAAQGLGSSTSRAGFVPNAAPDATPVTPASKTPASPNGSASRARDRALLRPSVQRPKPQDNSAIIQQSPF